MIKHCLLLTPCLLAFSAASLAQTPPISANTRLEITTQGSVARTPTLATLNAGVVKQAESAIAAMTDNANTMARVLEALKKAGVPANDITTSSLTLSPEFRYESTGAPKIVGYNASNQLSIRFHDIRKSGAILDALVKEGVNQINGPNLTVEDRQDAENEARKAAIKAARARAELYAAAAGLKVRKIVSMTEAPNYYSGSVGRASLAQSSLNQKTEVFAGEEAVTVSVSMVFELQ